jgi:hypothetical protein
MIFGGVDMPNGFSDDGYIINQAFFSDVRYGIKNSDFNGCGWMAAYNLLKYSGFNISWQTVAKEMNRCTLLFGLFGTNPFKLKKYLQQKGLFVKTTFVPSKASKALDITKAGILMYFHNKGAHFTAFYKIDSSKAKLRFLNVNSSSSTITGFLKEHSKLPFIYLITL